VQGIPPIDKSLHLRATTVMDDTLLPVLPCRRGPPLSRNHLRGRLQIVVIVEIILLVAGATAEKPLLVAAAKKPLSLLLIVPKYCRCL